MPADFLVLALFAADPARVSRLCGWAWLTSALDDLLAPPAMPTPVSTWLAREPSAFSRDGTLSFSRERQGRCSQHGGVREWRS
jgi:hypothetical protein